MNEKTNRKKVPPDGGWGWIIVIGSALNGVSTVPIIQGFGLIFKDVFPKFGFAATQGTAVMNVNLAFGMILGMMNGPLLRRFGYRRVATVGTFIYAAGITMTAFVDTFPLVMLAYGILASLGVGVTMSAFSYAVNSYFTTKRGRAIALAVSIAGLGPIVMPHVTSFLLSHYGSQGTILLYGAIALHSLIGAALLQPVEWHAKDATTVELESFDLQASGKNNFCSDDKNRYAEEFEGDFVENSSARFQRKGRIALLSESIETIHLGSSLQIFEDPYPETIARYYSVNNLNRQLLQEEAKRALLNEKTLGIALDAENDPGKGHERESPILHGLKRVARFCDLDLLRDPTYVNILIGMAIATFAEINFSVLTPFILADIGMPTEKIAATLSLMASVDLGFRMMAPFLGEWLRQPARIMYLIGLALLILSRTSLMFAHGYTSVLIVAIGLGAAKGIRSVYMNLVVPSHVPIHRLPYASGIQMVSNGIVLISAGPILGVIRDNTESYMPCIILINCLTLTTITLWVTELLIVRRRK